MPNPRIHLLALVVLLGAPATSVQSQGAPAQKPPPPAPPPSKALLQPDKTELAAKSPATYTIEFVTSRGPFKVEVHRGWSPNGADRLYYLVRNGFFDGARFFRALPGFIVQFGINADPKVTSAWKDMRIPDDSVATRNTRYRVTFAMAGPNTRTTQLFINLADNARLDKMGFSPIGTVITGTAVVDQFYGGYGEGTPNGAGPDQEKIMSQGNVYLAHDFPKLDYIVSAKIVKNLEK